MFDIEKFIESDELLDNQYKLIRTLNTDGGTADVWLALDARTVKNKKDLDEASYLDDTQLSNIGLLVAIKIYRPKNALDIEGEERFCDEYTIVYNCHHSNLIHPTHYSIFEGNPYLVLPYCKRGSSELLIGSLTDNNDIWKYILDVSSGLSYLHKNNPPIIHQDIKPANVLIDDHENYAITDFGISEKYNGQTDDEGIERSGTSAYMSPERFSPDFEPSKESDIWAFGATMYELISGQVPFGEDGGANQSKGKVNLQFPKGVSIEIQRLICACLDFSPEKRPTAETLVKAARNMQYPIKRPSYTKMFAGVAMMICMIVLSVVFILNHSSEPQESDAKQQISIVKDEQELFEEAMNEIRENSSDRILAGINRLELLAEKKYVPALYELAYTYGWVPEDESIRRKKYLGIELGNSKGENQSTSMPKSDSYNKLAMKYFHEVVIQDNPDYAEQKMKSSYRLGCYYRALSKKEEALKYFEEAVKEANSIGYKEYSESATLQINYIKDNL